VRLDDVFGLMKTISVKNIICEFLDVSDQRVIELCQQYRRDVSEFSIEKQKQAALRAGYKIVELAKEANDSSRELALLSAEV
jgi:ribosomal protein L18